MDDRCALCELVVFADLLLRTKPGPTPLALDYTWFNVWWISLAGRFSGVSRLPAFLQYIHGNLWVSWSDDDSPGLALRHRAGVPNWRRDQRPDRARQPSADTLKKNTEPARQSWRD